MCVFHNLYHLQLALYYYHLLLNQYLQALQDKHWLMHTGLCSFQDNHLVSILIFSRFRISTWLFILIFRITTGIFKKPSYLTVFFLFKHCNYTLIFIVLNNTNVFLIMLTRNSSSFYLFIDCSKILRRFFSIHTWFFIVFLNNNSRFYPFTHCSEIYRSLYCHMFCGYSLLCLIFFMLFWRFFILIRKSYFASFMSLGMHISFFLY